MEVALSDVLIKRYDANMERGGLLLDSEEPLGLVLYDANFINPATVSNENRSGRLARAASLGDTARYRITGITIPVADTILDFMWIVEVLGFYVVVHAGKMPPQAPSKAERAFVTVEGHLQVLEGYISGSFEETVQSRFDSCWRIRGITPLKFAEGKWRRGTRIESTYVVGPNSGIEGFFLDLLGRHEDV